MKFYFHCPKCNQKLSITDDYDEEFAECPTCSTMIQVPIHKINANNNNIFSSVSNKISDTLGVERLEGFSFKQLFSEVFKRHQWNEIENSFISGSIETTPDINSINVKWPTPWIFGQTLLFVVIMHFLLIFLVEEKLITMQAAALPFLFNGIIGIPTAALLFYWEMNIVKNISILQILKIAWIGGFISIIITFFAWKIGFRYESAIWAGPIEETAKLLTLFIFFKNNRYPYILNGLLFGAAVGVGFAVIETGQYIINYNGSLEVMIIRALCSPIAHVLYTALVGGALWKLKISKDFSFSILLNKRFLPIFIFAIGLHMFWNSDLLSNLWIKIVIVLVAGYSVIFSLVQEGLKQIKQAQKRNN